jgi:formylglycine-generating enzyme required for sulfatase activity
VRKKKDVPNKEGSAGAASGNNRVNRGGSWNNNANNCTVSNRNNNNLGFRVVRNAP